MMFHSEQGNTATCQESESNRSLIEPPDPVSGPQAMLNTIKARSQASIDSSNGSPGFFDRKSSDTWRINFVMWRNFEALSLTYFQNRDDPASMQNGSGWNPILKLWCSARGGTWKYLFCQLIQIANALEGQARRPRMQSAGLGGRKPPLIERCRPSRWVSRSRMSWWRWRRWKRRGGC